MSALLSLNKQLRLSACLLLDRSQALLLPSMLGHDFAARVYR